MCSQLYDSAPPLENLRMELYIHRPTDPRERGSLEINHTGLRPLYVHSIDLLTFQSSAKDTSLFPHHLLTTCRPESKPSMARYTRLRYTTNFTAFEWLDVTISIFWRAYRKIRQICAQQLRIRSRTRIIDIVWITFGRLWNARRIWHWSGWGRRKMGRGSKLMGWE